MLKDVGGFVSLYIEMGGWRFCAILIVIAVLTVLGFGFESFVLHAGAALLCVVFLEAACLATLSERISVEEENQWIAVAFIVTVVTALNVAMASTDDAALRSGARGPKGA